jgi:hypothetical protein
VIKLKDLIIEGRRPTISKMEEDQAFQVIKIKLLPGVVNRYNWVAKTKWNVPKITIDEARKRLIKVKKERFTNGEEIEYAIKLPGTIISFATRKLNHKEDEDETVEGVGIKFEVGYYNFSLTGWGELSWNMYDVEGLSRGDYDTDKGDYDIDPVKFIDKDSKI